MSRMFVAVVPPPEAVAHLDDFLAVRRDAAAFRWSDPEQWHLTLAFMDDVPDHALDELADRLAATAARHRPFTTRVAGGGAFPHPDRARVLYARLGASDEAVARLDLLAAGCRAAMSKAGARVDGQRFRPHLTLGRLGRPDNVTPWVRLLDGYEGPDWVADEIALVASHLGEGPRRRPRHEVVGVDAELDVGVGAQGVVLGELASHLGRGLGRESLALVHLGQLALLGLGHPLELDGLQGEQRLLGVALRADRDVLAGTHAQRAGREGGEHPHRGSPLRRELTTPGLCRSAAS